jgi:hypothetical protein
MAQFLRPSSDVTTTNWTRNSGSSAFWTYINEVTADAGDYVQTQTQSASLEVGLSTVDVPVNRDDHIVRLQAWVLGSNPAERHTVLLLQGATTIATVANNAVITRNTPTTLSYTLTTNQANSITDYSNLRLRFTAGTLGSGETYRVSWAEMEVPDAPVLAPTRYILIT